MKKLFVLILISTCLNPVKVYSQVSPEYFMVSYQTTETVMISPFVNLQFDTKNEVEQATYQPGYNWISFPKLDRPNDDPVDAQTLLSGIDPFPSNLTMHGLPPQSHTETSRKSSE